MKNKIQTKDFINIGLFTAIYFVLFFAVGMLGYVPIFMLLIPLLCPMVTGIVFMLYMTRITHFGMVTITSLLLAILMIVTGHHWIAFPISLLTGLLADYILYLGNYRKWINIVIGYAIFSEWVIGMMYPIFFARDAFFSDLLSNYGQSYVDTLASITPTWVFYLMILIVAVGATIGAYLGRITLKKHFKKAGIA